MVLRVCSELAVGSYTTFCTVLTAYAESDFNGRAISKNPTSSGYYSEGLFQQTLPWWPHDHFDPVASTKAFIKAFRASSKQPVQDCWDTQHWNAPNWRDNPTAFWEAKETQNYNRRLEAVKKIIETGRLPNA